MTAKTGLRGMMLGGVVTGPIGLAAVGALGLGLAALVLIQETAAQYAAEGLIALAFVMIAIAVVRRWTLARRALRCPRCGALMHSRYPDGGSVRVCCPSCMTVFETSDYRAAFPARHGEQRDAPAYRELRVDP